MAGSGKIKVERGMDMRKIYPKISAIVAMLMTVLSIGLLVTAIVFLFVEDPVEKGVGFSTAFWIYVVIVSILSLKYYTIDAILSVVNVFRKIDPVFNSVLAVVLFVAIPLGICIGGRLGINIIIWFSYYLGMFILELVSIIRLIKMQDRVDPRE